jgi:hypothetical protein
MPHYLKFNCLNAVIIPFRACVAGHLALINASIGRNNAPERGLVQAEGAKDNTPDEKRNGP